MLRRSSVLGPILALAAGSAALAQSTTRASVDSVGTQGNAISLYPAITPDGRYVAFESGATNLVAGDTNAVRDVFVHDRQTGVTTRVSVSSTGTQAMWGGNNPVISADGRYVAFTGASDDLVAGDTNGVRDVFRHDRQTGTTIRVSLDPSGAQFPTGIESSDPCISGDGRYVGFYNWADDTTSEAIFVRDVTGATTTQVSVDPSNAPSPGGYYRSSISADGRYIAFEGFETTVVPGDTNSFWDVFVRDLQTGTTVLASADAGGGFSNGFSGEPSISANGRTLAFTSYATDLVAGDANGKADVFVRDLVAGTTELASTSSSAIQGNDDVSEVAISPDGRYVAFGSPATQLVPSDTNAKSDVFLRDRQTGVTTRLSVDSAGGQGNDHSGIFGIAVSQDAGSVAFWTDSVNLVLGDSNGVGDVLVRDRMEADATPLCFGDGTGAACPCANTGAPNRGCQNSSSTGGAVLGATGVASLSADTLHVTIYGAKPSVLCLLFQGDAQQAPVLNGDGLLCLDGTLKRLFWHTAKLGVMTAPQGADLSVSARSAAKGDTIPPGGERFYQAYYRDTVAGFCPDPPGKTWNVSNVLSVVWAP